MRLRLLSNLSVLVRVQADKDIHESSGANNPVTPIQLK
jgi:hypothetical protein